MILSSPKITDCILQITDVVILLALGLILAGFLTHKWIDRFFTSKGVSDVLTFKAIATIPSLVFISSASLINFSFAFFCSSFVVVPLFFFTMPTTFKILKLLQGLSIIIFSPVGLVLIASYYLQKSPEALLTTLIDQFTLYGNFIFPFLAVIQFPTTLSYLKLLRM